MDSDIKICNRKYEDDITDEEKNKLNLFKKQYHINIERLEKNKEIISIKNTFFPPVILIMFLFSCACISIFVYLYIKSFILQLIIGFPAVIINGYSYLIFYNNFLFHEKEEEETVNIHINTILKEIDSILDKYNITKKDFYKEYSINLKI